MTWEIQYLPEAVKDLKKLAGDQRIIVAKALRKVSDNPLPMKDGGYGKPLGNQNGRELCGFLKIKIKSTGIRIVYRLYRSDSVMLVIVVGVRADHEVYDIAADRIHKHTL